MRRRFVLLSILCALATIAGPLAACGDEDEPAPGADRPVIEDPGPVHIHGLGINPRDGALFIATHTGLFRSAPGATTSSRVGDRYQDTMGFTVVGPDWFLGSGHPDGRDRLPPFLGLIESRDAGNTWKPRSLLGRMDFHVLEAEREHVYGYGSDFETRESRFMVSTDGGETWDDRPTPEPLASLAIHPDDPSRLIASGERTIYESRDGGRRWEPRGGESGLVVWHEPDRLVLVQEGGVVKSSADGVSWELVGDIDGEPAAFEAEADGLYAALHDGTIKRSTDGGESWSVRSRP